MCSTRRATTEARIRECKYIIVPSNFEGCVVHASGLRPFGNQEAEVQENILTLLLLLPFCYVYTAVHVCDRLCVRNADELKALARCQVICTLCMLENEHKHLSSTEYKQTSPQPPLISLETNVESSDWTTLLPGFQEYPVTSTETNTKPILKHDSHDYVVQP
ncbi:hypothetical protein BDZ91DRAFT_722658 [Kalaharituber pfeilii]|nr:hypothetical protein BDZ91DRAFT_722658 [Kalaharituber pfeilii]